MFENCISKLSFDPNEKCEFVCKCTMTNRTFWLTIYLMNNAALGLHNLLTEYFRNNERNFSALSDRFLHDEISGYKDDRRAVDVIPFGLERR